MALFAAIPWHDALHELVEQWDSEIRIHVGGTPDHAFPDEAGAGWSQGIDVPA
jgi:hypothetical protein